MQRKYDENNVFWKIIVGDIPCDKVYEDENVLCFHDLNPKSPVHVLLVPKRKFVCFDDFVEGSSDEEIAYFFRIARKIAKDLGCESYRIVANCGRGAEQVIFHYHLHIMGYNY
ncbi:MAG: histidine triad nucleotide-binding protein [Rickettsiales bacterium]|jgi:diadenosine tetraphosphate (Ap4A) HIT family hydrolase|nr:histidine triad nucleotide-binding protein [Rickettsiales bacterium]